MYTHPAEHTLCEIRHARSLIERDQERPIKRVVLTKPLALAGLTFWLANLHLISMDDAERVEAARELDRIRCEFPSLRARAMLRVAQLNFPTHY